MKVWLIPTLFFLLFTAPAAFGYELILKNGKVIRGTWLREDSEKISIKDTDGITLNFKKSLIDLQKTAAANLTPEPAIEKKETEETAKEEAPKKPKKPARVYNQSDVNRLRSEYPLESGTGVEFEEGAPLEPQKGRTGEEWQEITQSLLAAVKDAEQTYQQLSAKCKQFQGATIQTHMAINPDGTQTDLVEAKENTCGMADDAKTALEQARQEHANAVQQARQENIPTGYIITE